MHEAYHGCMGPLASALKARRDELGVTQIVAARIVDVSQASYSRWERQTAPDAAYFDAIAKFLGYKDADDGTFCTLMVRNYIWLAKVRDGDFEV